MILAEAHISDLVDTIEYQLKQMATAEDLIRSVSPVPTLAYRLF